MSTNGTAFDLWWLYSDYIFVLILEYRILCSVPLSFLKVRIPLYGSCNQVRLHQNYRSTRCIVEAATALIQHNQKRCQEKQAHTDNAVGDKVSFCRLWFQAVNSSLLWTVSFQSSVHPTDSMGESEPITSLTFSSITLSAALYKDLLSLLPTTLSSSAASRLWWWSAEQKQHSVRLLWTTFSWIVLARVH